MALLQPLHASPAASEPRHTHTSRDTTPASPGSASQKTAAAGTSTAARWPRHRPPRAAGLRLHRSPTNATTCTPPATHGRAPSAPATTGFASGSSDSPSSPATPPDAPPSSSPGTKAHTAKAPTNAENTASHRATATTKAATSPPRPLRPHPPRDPKPPLLQPLLAPAHRRTTTRIPPLHRTRRRPTRHRHEPRVRLVRSAVPKSAPNVTPRRLDGRTVSRPNGSGGGLRWGRGDRCAHGSYRGRSPGSPSASRVGVPDGEPQLRTDPEQPPGPVPQPDGTPPPSSDEVLCTLTPQPAELPGDDLRIDTGLRQRPLQGAVRRADGSHRSLPDRAIAGKGSSKDFQRGYLGGDHGGYVRHHDPFVYFKSVTSKPRQRRHLRRSRAFAQSLRRPPALSCIVPNNSHNMHTGPSKPATRGSRTG